MLPRRLTPRLPWPSTASFSSCVVSLPWRKPGPPLSRPSSSSATSSAPKVFITFPSGRQSSFLTVWLRDHCREERSYHPKTKQRLVDTASIPPDLVPLKVEHGDVGVELTWPEGYSSFFPYAFLQEHAYDPPILPPKEFKSKKVLWTKEIGKAPPTVSYEEVMASEHGVWTWLSLINTYGFSLVKGIPPTAEATEQLLERIAFIRPTHYGAFWDFEANLEHGDLAYSEAELGGHTDTTYFTDPCGLQLFHLLSPPESHQGGLNLLIDGFRCASLLATSHPSLYAFLSTTPIPAHASGTGSASLPSGVHMRPLLPAPVLTHDPRTGELKIVRWNAEDRDVVGKGWTGEMVETWYESVRAWEALLRSEEARLWTRMERGTAVIFDNHRVLHGRSAFTGKRRLCGGYIAGDDYRSRLAGLSKQFGSQRRPLDKDGDVWAEYV